MAKTKNLKYYQNLVLTTSKFMANYYNIHEKNLKKLSHEYLQAIFPKITKATKEDSTRENILTGKIVLVKDCYHEIIGYQNPLVKIDKIQMEKEPSNNELNIAFVDKPEEDTLQDLENIDLDNLSKYELEQLLKLSKSTNDSKTKRTLKKELYFDRENHNTKKVALEKIREREIRKDDINDKY